MHLESIYDIPNHESESLNLFLMIYNIKSEIFKILILEILISIINQWFPYRNVDDSKINILMIPIPKYWWFQYQNYQ